MRSFLTTFAIALALWIIAPGVYAHSGSTAFIEMEIADESATGAWWLSLKDLHVAVGIDLDNDGQIRFGEFKQQKDLIVNYASAHLSAWASEAPCKIHWQNPVLSTLDDGIYAQLPLVVICPNGEVLSQLKYSALFGVDTSHRAIVQLSKGEDNRVVIFSPDHTVQSWSFSEPAVWKTAFTYIQQGVSHILEGYDHLLFLLALLVPILLCVGKTTFAVSVKRYYKDLGLSLLKVVTAFTVGHSVTLILATIFSVTPPSSWVETIIAVSVVIAGVNIVFPLFRESSWRVAALFGLIHGFGFASVLAELTLSKTSMALSLFSFNIGVEIGQLLVVLIVAPLFIVLVRGSLIPSLARYGAAGTAVSIGMFWTLERVPL